jgi:hypothetical protein
VSGQGSEHEGTVPFVMKGPKGDKGEQGEKGNSRLTLAQGRAIVVLFILSVGLSVFAIFWVSHEVNHNNKVQAQNSMVFQDKLCRTLRELSDNKAPSGSPIDNPSRAFEQKQQSILSELAPDIGCH